MSVAGVETVRESTGFPESAYRSSRTRGRWAQVGLALLAAVQTAGLIVVPVAIGYLNSAEAGRGVDGWAFWVNVESLYVILFLPVVLVATILFIAWLARAVDNAPALGAGIPRWTPRWAVAFWFIPVINLIAPYRVVADLYRRMATPTVPRSARLPVLWWLALWAGVAITSTSGAVVNADSTSDQLRAASLFWAIGTALLIASALLAIIIVRRVETDAERRRQADPDEAG